MSPENAIQDRYDAADDARAQEMADAFRPLAETKRQKYERMALRYAAACERVSRAQQEVEEIRSLYVEAQKEWAESNEP